MKRFKYLFLSLLLAGFLLPMAANAQAVVLDDPGNWPVMYEDADGEVVFANAEGKFHTVETPRGNVTVIFQGQLPEDIEGPKKAVRNEYTGYTVFITPSGQVTVVWKIKPPKDV